jgi:hypothetical protein
MQLTCGHYYAGFVKRNKKKIEVEIVPGFVPKTRKNARIAWSKKMLQNLQICMYMHVYRFIEQMTIRCMQLTCGHYAGVAERTGRKLNLRLCQILWPEAKKKL